MMCSDAIVAALQSFCVCRGSAEATRDVILGPPVLGIGEDRLGRGKLDELAEIHEGGKVRAARGLLHVVRHDGDAVIRLELTDELFDLLRRDRVKGGSRL